MTTNKIAKIQRDLDRPDRMHGYFAMTSSELEFCTNALAALRAQQERENPKPLTLDDLWEEEEGSDIPMTNAERIRAMTDKELTEFIGYNSLCDRIQSEGTWCEEHTVCENCLTEWLQQPAKEADHGTLSAMHNPDAIPSVDAVEVVCCKDCKYLYNGLDDYCCTSHRGLVRISEGSFCSYGERRTNNG